MAQDTNNIDKYFTVICDDGKEFNFKLKAIHSNDAILVEKAAHDERVERLSGLVGDSTNLWLYENLDVRSQLKATHLDEDEEPLFGNGNRCNKCGNNMINTIIALLVIIVQIVAYIVMTHFLIQGVNDDYEAQQENCYGPNCEVAWDGKCTDISTSLIVSVLLIGFIWPDVINTFALVLEYPVAACICLIEIFTAIICGYLTGLYSDGSFDAIGGAVGVLFVHDLDESVFASFGILGASKKRPALIKKICFVFGWILLAMIMALSIGCIYNNDQMVPDAFHSCVQGEFQCEVGAECIWEGFVCNGVSDCPNGEDEYKWTGLGKSKACNYIKDIECPDDYFMCLSSGKCLENIHRCDGILDCEDASDEGRSSNCTQFIRDKKCDEELTITYPQGDDWYQSWSGQFKCSSGQCINASYACDGIPGDCADKSDDFPYFNQFFTAPLYRSSCPYSQLIACPEGHWLCKQSGKCIAQSQLCDKVKDCSDGLDERGCIYQCNNNDEIAFSESFQCGGVISGIDYNRSIIYKSYEGRFPDAVFYDPVNFYDGNDTDANLLVVVEKLTYYDVGLCIPGAWRCDGTADCPDGSDENSCGLFGCEDDEYKCPKSSDCIPKSMLCDLVVNCVSGLDEHFRECQKHGRIFDNAEQRKDCRIIDPYWCLSPKDNVTDICYNCIGTDKCITARGMCDAASGGWNDDIDDLYGAGVKCPFKDDEDDDICAQYVITTTKPPGGGPITCDGTPITEYVEYYNYLWYTVDIPIGTQYLWVTTCNPGTSMGYRTELAVFDSSGKEIATTNGLSSSALPECSISSSDLAGILLESVDISGNANISFIGGETYSIRASSKNAWYSLNVSTSALCANVPPTKSPTASPTDYLQLPCDGISVYNEILEESYAGQFMYEIWIPNGTTTLQISTCDPVSISVRDTWIYLKYRNPYGSLSDVYCNNNRVRSGNSGFGDCLYGSRLSDIYVENIDTCLENGYDLYGFDAPYYVQIYGDTDYPDEIGGVGLFGLWAKCT